MSKFQDYFVISEYPRFKSSKSLSKYSVLFEIMRFNFCSCPSSGCSSAIIGIKVFFSSVHESSSYKFFTFSSSTRSMKVSSMSSLFFFKARRITYSSISWLTRGFNYSSFSNSSFSSNCYS